MDTLTEKIQNQTGLILKLLDKGNWSYKKIGNNYMGACPECRNGFRTPNTQFNIDTNSFKCHSCGTSGGLKKLAELLNVDFLQFLEEEGIIEKKERKENQENQKEKETVIKKAYLDIEKISTAVLSAEVREYLKSRYIDYENETLKKYIREVRERQTEVFKHLEKYYIDGYRLLIPVFDENDCLSFVKIRNIKDKEPKVKNLKGLKPGLIGLDRLKNINENDFVIIVEGEIDFLTALSVSPNDYILALPSSNYTLKEKEIELLPNNIVLLLDNDEAGEKAKKTLATSLRLKGKNIFIGNYPKDIKDFNDLVSFYKGDLEKVFEVYQSILDEAFINKFSLVNTSRNIANRILSKLEQKIKDAEEKGEEKPKPNLLETGFQFMDELLDGGFRRGLYAITGQPAIGKTSFILALAKQLAKNDIKSLIISLEMTDEDLTIQLLSWLSHVKKRDILDEVLSYHDYLTLLDKIRENPIFDNIIIDTESRDISSIEESIRKTLIEIEDKPLVVFIDYLQQIRPDKEVLKRAGSDFRIQMRDISYRLKDIANNYEIPLVVISSTQRENYKEDKKQKEPNYLALFKESGDIEYSLYAGYFLDYLSPEDQKTYEKKNYEIPIKIVKVKSRFGTVRDENHKFIYKNVILDYRNGDLKDLDVIEF